MCTNEVSYLWGRLRSTDESKTEYIKTIHDQTKEAESLNIAGKKIENWNANDELLLPSTVFRKNKDLENEVVVIQKIGNKKINLKSSLKYAHSIKDREKVIANLTRSVVFKSERHDKNEDRAHVMLMMCGGSTIEYAKFENLGRSNKRKKATDTSKKGGTNPRGRYPVHFHKCGFEKPAKFKGNVVIGSP